MLNATGVGWERLAVLANNVTYTWAKASQGTCSLNNKTVTCNLGTVTSGGSATITLKVTRTSTKTAVVNNATVTSSSFENHMADNAVTTNRAVTAHRRRTT